MRISSKAAAGVAAFVVAVSLLGGGDQAPPLPSPTSDEGTATGQVQPVPTMPPPEPAPAKPPAPDLLQTGAGGDGDSWRDTSGREYRLGLINTPETNECYGSTATAERTRLTADGFLAEVYTTDSYSRGVAVVTLADGTNVNVHLARHGFANDRYLERFRHENPGLADELDVAFAAAKAEGAGLWGSCSQGGATAPEPAPAPADSAPAGTSACHPDYVTCIPVKGDGSGRGPANDLDCGSIRQQVQLRAAGGDPYRLDADGDGAGCQSS